MCCKKKQKASITFKDIDNALGQYYEMYGMKDRYYSSNDDNLGLFLRYINDKDYDETELESQLNEDADIETCKYLLFDIDSFPCFGYINIGDTNGNTQITGYQMAPTSSRYEIIFQVLQYIYKHKKHPSSRSKHIEQIKYIFAMCWAIIGPFGYYFGLYANYQVIIDYISNNEYGYCIVTIIAILGGLIANSFYANTKLSIYKNHSFCFAFILSIFYLTPAYLLINLLIFECQKRIYNKHKYSSIDSDWNNYNLIINFFESPILECIQIYIVGQYILYSENTRKLNNITYPTDNREFYLLLYACYGSFRGLSDAAWSRIEPMIKSCAGKVNGRSKLQRTILFRVRAFIETLLRALRFMVISAIYGGLIGFLMLIIEIIWKYSLVSCCKCITNKIRGNQDKLPIGFKIYLVATWLIFSHERFKTLPYFMRIMDIFIWSIFCIIFSIIGVYVHYEFPEFISNTVLGKILYKVEINGICNKFFDFRNDCYPIELLIIFIVLLIILMIIYRLSPPIFILAEKTGQQIKLKQQKQMEMMQNAKLQINNQTNDTNDSNDNYISKQRVMIDRMNRNSNIEQQLQQIDIQEPNYIQSQMAMIDTMNNEPQIQQIQEPNYIQSQMAMIDTMNNSNNNKQNNSSKKGVLSLFRKRKPKQDISNNQQIQQPNYIQSQMAMIDTMNNKSTLNYINSQQIMIDTMNDNTSQQIQMPKQNYISSQMQMINTMNE